MLSPSQYDLVRGDLADSLDVRVGTLDKEVGLLRRTTKPAPAAAALPAELQDTDVANARRFAHRHGDDVRFTPERGWYVWDGRRWAADDKCLGVQERGKETLDLVYRRDTFCAGP